MYYGYLREKKICKEYIITIALDLQKTTPYLSIKMDFLRTPQYLKENKNLLLRVYYNNSSRFIEKTTSYLSI